MKDKNEEKEYEEIELENKLFYIALFDLELILTNNDIYIK
jgi:hypothetical protein